MPLEPFTNSAVSGRILIHLIKQLPRNTEPMVVVSLMKNIST